MLTLVALLAVGQIPLEVKGADVRVVKVDRIIVVKEDRTVVNVPFAVHAPSGGGLYFWSYPPGVVATDKGDALHVTVAPKGDLSITVKAISAKLDKDGRFRGFQTELGSLSFSVGEAKPPPDPIDPPPPPPTDPLGKALAAAYAADSGKDKRPALASVFREAAKKASDEALFEVKDLVAFVAERRKATVGDALPITRGAIGEYLDANLKGGFLNPASRQLAEAEFAKIATALEALR